jgi:predicted ATP-grasp superfamily ATP-dependent carboligase
MGRADMKAQSSQRKPAVIILNLFYTGLGIARNLSGYGVRIVGLSADRKGYGRFSRFCEVRFAPNSHEEPLALKEYLLGMAKELPGAVIFPTRDADVLFLDTYREELAAHYRLAIPAHDALMKVIDKAALLKTARAAGVSIPLTLLVNGADDISLVAEKVGYPCVVKPVRSVDWRKGSNWEKVGGRKAFLVANEAEFREEFDRIESITPQLLVQEWIPGSTEQIVILGGYIGDKGEPIAYFAARKLVQSPEDFGTGCIVEIATLPELLEPTVGLCKALEYRGMAEVEFKKDDRTGEYKLIEINTRHWDWHRLGMAHNVNVSWAAYCDLTGGKYSPPSKAKTSASKWVADDATWSYFLSGVYRRKIQVKTFLEKLKGRRQYGIFEWADPIPSVYNFLTATVAGTSRQIGRKLFRK